MRIDPESCGHREYIDARFDADNEMSKYSSFERLFEEKEKVENEEEEEENENNDATIYTSKGTFGRWQRPT